MNFRKKLLMLFCILNFSSLQTQLVFGQEEINLNKNNQMYHDGQLYQGLELTQSNVRKVANAAKVENRENGANEVKENICLKIYNDQLLTIENSICSDCTFASVDVAKTVGLCGIVTLTGLGFVALINQVATSSNTFVFLSQAVILVVTALLDLATIMYFGSHAIYSMPISPILKYYILDHLGKIQEILFNVDLIHNQYLSNNNLNSNNFNNQIKINEETDLGEVLENYFNEWKENSKDKNYFTKARFIKVIYQNSLRGTFSPDGTVYIDLNLFKEIVLGYMDNEKYVIPRSIYERTFYFADYWHQHQWDYNWKWRGFQYAKPPTYQLKNSHERFDLKEKIYQGLKGNNQHYNYHVLDSISDSNGDYNGDYNGDRFLGNEECIDSYESSEISKASIATNLSVTNLPVTILSNLQQFYIKNSELDADEKIYPKHNKYNKYNKYKSTEDIESNYEK